MKKILIISFIIVLMVALICVVGCNEPQDESNVLGIYVSKYPDKVNYFAGEELDISGCEITVRTKNNKNYTVEVTPDMVSGFSSALGNHTLTITYSVGSASFITTQSITVSTRVAVSAKITTAPKNVTFIEGQRIDLSGLIAEVTFSDGTIADRHFGAFSMNKSIAELGMEEVELRLDHAIIKVQITVLQKKIEGLKVTNPPQKTVYSEGELFNPDGLEIYSLFNDGSIASLVDFEVIDLDKPLVASQSSVIVKDKYSDLKIELQITVNALEINSIELLNKEDIRTLYLVNAIPDFSDIIANVVFGDGTEKMVNYTSLVFDFPEDKPLTVGDYTVTVKYKYATNSDKSDSFVITVSEKKEPIKIRVETTNEFNPQYIKDEDISLNGLCVYVIYNDSSEDWAIYAGEFNSNIENFTMTEKADINNQYIVFRCGDAIERLEIYVSYDESEYDAPPKEE